MKRGPGRMVRTAVTRLIGLSLVFCIRPPQQKTVLPVKYSKLFPGFVFFGTFDAS